ncbi:MAG: 2-oxo acid dehydrogenase subunit E2 [Deltaproteobacteria bacterium]|nr:2-oxo acid dehydrogenase subunit E2 [Deltaproteobacteria bacterium]
MATDVIMPALGVAQEKGILISWLKAEGESVRKGEPLMEVETDKATVEIEAPASGTLAGVTASPGDAIPVGQTIAVILEAGEPLSRRAEPHSPSPPGAAASQTLRDQVSEKAVSPSRSAAAPLQPGRIPASPAAKRIAKEKGIDLTALKGSGPEGSILAEDVLQAAATQNTASGGPPRVKEILPLTAMRRIVAQRMAASKQNAPHFYLSMDVDMTAPGRKRQDWKKKGEERIPTINDFVLWACARTLGDFPSLNSSYTDQGIQVFSDINIGVAVALEDGLVVPVIRNADRLALQQVAIRSRELMEKAQKKKLLPLDYEGGTFSVSNLGMFGVDRFVAIINPPQSAILAVGQVAGRVVPHGEGIAIRSMMTMTLSIDHRVANGVIAARFLQEVKQLLEDASVS